MYLNHEFPKILKTVNGNPVKWDAVLKAYL